MPNIHITISGSAVAVYAAVVSTITGSVQLWHFFRDRARIKLTVQRNMEIIGGPVHRKGFEVVPVVRTVFAFSLSGSSCFCF